MGSVYMFCYCVIPNCSNYNYWLRLYSPLLCNPPRSELYLYMGSLTLFCWTRDHVFGLPQQATT